MIPPFIPALIPVFPAPTSVRPAIALAAPLTHQPVIVRALIAGPMTENGSPDLGGDVDV